MIVGIVEVCHAIDLIVNALLLAGTELLNFLSLLLS